MAKCEIECACAETAFMAEIHRQNTKKVNIYGENSQEVEFFSLHTINDTSEIFSQNIFFQLIVTQEKIG